jgi:hypothetical protein
MQRTSLEYAALFVGVVMLAIVALYLAMAIYDAPVG